MKFSSSKIFKTFFTTISRLSFFKPVSRTNVSSMFTLSVICVICFFANICTGLLNVESSGKSNAAAFIGDISSSHNSQNEIARDVVIFRTSTSSKKYEDLREEIVKNIDGQSSVTLLLVSNIRNHKLVRESPIIIIISEGYSRVSSHLMKNLIDKFQFFITIFFIATQKDFLFQDIKRIIQSRYRNKQTKIIFVAVDFPRNAINTVGSMFFSLRAMNSVLFEEVSGVLTIYSLNPLEPKIIRKTPAAILDFDFFFPTKLINAKGYEIKGMFFENSPHMRKNENGLIVGIDMIILYIIAEKINASLKFIIFKRDDHGFQKFNEGLINGKYDISIDITVKVESLESVNSI